MHIKVYFIYILYIIFFISNKCHNFDISVDQDKHKKSQFLWMFFIYFKIKFLIVTKFHNITVFTQILLK